MKKFRHAEDVWSLTRWNRPDVGSPSPLRCALRHGEGDPARCRRARDTAGAFREAMPQACIHTAAEAGVRAAFADRLCNLYGDLEARHLSDFARLCRAVEAVSA